MSRLIEILIPYLEQVGVETWAAELAARCFGGLLVALLAVLSNWVAKRIILQAIERLVNRTPWEWDNVMRDKGVFTRLSHIAPALVIKAFGADVLGDGAEVNAWVSAAVTVYSVAITWLVLAALLDSVQEMISRTRWGSGLAIKGFTQAIKLVLFLIASILVLSILIGKSPVYFLSGVGALTAVLLLIFRDALLGLVAGVMISVNQMVRVGDWIEMPKAGADGDVIDVSLTTVKVSNWDRTITTIPSYDLISQSFKNWRGMFESGGRRIKRSILIDMQSIRFVDAALLERFMRIRRLRPYLESKTREVQQANEAESDLDLSVLCNGRRLTNLGTFRAYCLEYLRAHPQIRQDMILLVRQLDPTPHGLPLEIYVFVQDTRWTVYESVQADIFDHLLAVIGEFGLRVFQEPGGHDFRAFGQAAGGPAGKDPAAGRTIP